MSEAPARMRDIKMASDKAFIPVADANGRLKALGLRTWSEDWKLFFRSDRLEYGGNLSMSKDRLVDGSHVERIETRMKARST